MLGVGVGVGKVIGEYEPGSMTRGSGLGRSVGSPAAPPVGERGLRALGTVFYSNSGRR